MLIYNEKIFYVVSQEILLYLFDLLKPVMGKTWEDCKKLLFTFSADQDIVWGQRFYLLLIECFREWALYIKPFNKDKTESIFRKMFKHVKSSVPYYNTNLYYYAKFNEFESKDKLFTDWLNGKSVKSTENNDNVFKQNLEVSQQKENDKSTLNKMSTNKKKRSRTSRLGSSSKKDISNLCESLRNLDPKRSLSISKADGLTQIFERVKMERKQLMHQIFRNKVRIEKIELRRQIYQDSIIQNYDKLESFLNLPNKNKDKTKDMMVKELELGNWLFDYFDKIYNQNKIPSIKIKNLRKEICLAMERIYGYYPKFYDKFLGIGTEIFEYNEEYSCNQSEKSQSVYSNRNHSIRDLNFNSLKNSKSSFSLNKNGNKTYSFSKNDESVRKANESGTNDVVFDEYDNSSRYLNQTGKPLSFERKSKGRKSTVRTFLKENIEEDKAFIKSSNNNLNKKENEVEKLLSNIKSVPVKMTKTLKNYDDISIDKISQNDSSKSFLKNIVSRRTRRESNRNQNKSQGSVKINFNKQRTPKQFKIENSKKSSKINFDTEYGSLLNTNKKNNKRDKENSLLSKNDTSLGDIKKYRSNSVSISSLKKKNPRLTKCIFKKNSLNYAKMDNLLIDKQLNNVQMENQILLAKKKKLEEIVSELTERERSLSIRKNQSANTTKRRDLSSMKNTIDLAKTKNKTLALDCLKNEFNRKNEIYNDLKMRFNQINKSFKEKVINNYQINIKKTNEVRDTILTDVIGIDNTRSRRDNTGLTLNDSSQFIEF